MLSKTLFLLFCPSVGLVIEPETRLAGSGSALVEMWSAKAAANET